MEQLKLHNRIDQVLSVGPSSVDRSELSSMINANPDARHYFFSRANQEWLEWLWSNGFLDAIKKKADDPTRYGYWTPELHYLTKMAENVPAQVVDIILKVPVSVASFNPEVIDRFIRICSELKAEQLKRVVSKIRDERWIGLMSRFDQGGFEFERMLRALAEANDSDSLLVLSEAMLAVRSKEEMAEIPDRSFFKNPFYIKDLADTKVFKHLVEADDDHAEQAFALVSDVLRKVVLLGGESEEKEFSVEEPYPLFNIDFFTLELGRKRNLSDRESVEELAASVRLFAKRLIGKGCGHDDKARRLFNANIKTLPDSRAMWRLQMYVLSLCPTVFRNELKEQFIRIFATDKYADYTLGAEYERSLNAGFSALTDEDQRDYVRQVFEYFGRQTEDEDADELRKNSGLRILSSICTHLTDDERIKCRDILGQDCSEKYEPQPAVGEIRGGSVHPQGPITQEEFGKLSIEDIANNLRTIWTPKKLREKHTDADFLRPRNAEGVGSQLQADMPNRLQEYVDKAQLFFERDVLDQHYTHVFLRSLYDILRNNKEVAVGIDWDGFVKLGRDIVASGLNEQFDTKERSRRHYDAWLSNWTGVHDSFADAIAELLRGDSGEPAIEFEKYRADLLAFLKYLFTHPDPTEAEDQSSDNDPHTKAINAVRGRTFEALVLFVYQDSKQYGKEKKVKISSDVKEMYEELLAREKTRAIRFMFGHYLPRFYFLDRSWMGGLLPSIFPAEPDKSHLYVAAWEGYLANNLYHELFFDSAMQQLYKRGLDIEYESSEERRPHREPDEGLAVHVALAFMYYEEFDSEHDLFKAFWDKDDAEQHAELISFIGRLFASGDNAQARELLEKEQYARDRMTKLWDWVLDRDEGVEVLTQFGTWINVEKSVFSSSLPWLAERVRKTLEKTKGSLDWDYGLMRSIEKLATAAPEDTLHIVRLYMLEGGVRSKDSNRFPLHLDQEWFTALKTLFDHPTTKSGLITLVNDLVREGGSPFWALKDVVNEEAVAEL